MADNVGYTPGSGANVAADEASYSGDTALVQLVRLVEVSGTEGSKTVGTSVLGTEADPKPASGDDDGSINAHLRYIAHMLDQTSTVNPGNTANTTPWLFVIRDAAGNARGANVDASNRLVTAADAQGTVAHDAADSGNPIKVGAKAIAHGANPTAVAANDRTDLYANRAGIPFVIGGHPNVITTEYLWTSAQTNDAIVTVSAGAKIVVTQIQVVVDEATTVGVGFRIGFATATLPTAPTDGNAAAGYLAGHTGMVPGSIYTRGDGSGILGVGADDEDLRITAEAPTSGEARAYISYYTIDS